MDFRIVCYDRTIVSAQPRSNRQNVTFNFKAEKLNFLIFFLCSLAVHPNKLLIATGQATSGQDRKENKVSWKLLSIFWRAKRLREFDGNLCGK